MNFKIRSFHKYIKIFLLFLILFELYISTTFIGMGHGVDPEAKVNVGDSQVFEYTKYLANSTKTLILENGTALNVTWSQGFKVKVVITTINGTGADQTIYCQVEFDELLLKEQPCAYWVAKTVDDVTYWQEEVDYYNKKQTGYTGIIKGNYYQSIQKVASDFDANTYTNEVIIFNWKTGWREYYYFEYYSIKNNVYGFQSQIEITMKGSTASEEVNATSYSFEFFLVSIIVVLPIVRKFNRKKK